MAKTPVKAPPPPPSATTANGPAPTPPPAPPVGGSAPPPVLGEEHFPPGTVTDPATGQPVTPPAPPAPPEEPPAAPEPNSPTTGGAVPPAPELQPAPPAPTPIPGTASLDDVISTVGDIEVDNGLHPIPPAASPPSAPVDPQVPIGDGVEDVADDKHGRDTSGLGDWDGDGKAGGSAVKADRDKTNAELGAEVGKSHAENAADDTASKPSLRQISDNVKRLPGGTLPNGKDVDDEFYTAYSSSYDLEVEQQLVDAMSDDERIRRIERTLGLRSPRE